MADVVLQIVGSTVGFMLGGPLGAAIGGTIGGAIGRTFMPTQRFEGPRLQDLKVTAATYGAPIPLVYGPGVRVTGNVIWTTGLIERSSTQRQGGKGGGGGSSTTTYAYSLSCAVSLGEGPINSLRRIWANGKVIFDRDRGAITELPHGFVAERNNGTHVVANTIRFYRGTFDQPADPTMQGALGAGQVPAYRGTSYVVIEGLELADFGNGMPNLEFELVGQEAITVADVVRDICARCGADTPAITALTMACAGYVIGRDGVTGTAALQPLAAAYNFTLAEARGQLRFVMRGAPPRFAIPREEMGARPAGDEAGEAITFQRGAEVNLPREVSISYFDRDQAYQTNTQRASRRLGSALSNVSIELALSLSPAEGAQAAERMLWQAWGARQAANFNLTDRWLELAAGDPIALPVGADGAFWPFRVARATRGDNGVITVDAAFEDPAVSDSLLAGAAGGGEVGSLREPGLTRWYAFNGPLLRDADDNAGFYWGASAGSRGWRGANVLRSTDDGVTYGPLSPISIRAPIGDCQTLLGPGPSTVWDRANTVEVLLIFDDGSIESVSEDAVLSGANAAWVGSIDGQRGEVIQFATAELVGPATYRLSNLLRGRRGTEHAIANHAPDDVFVLLEPDSLVRSDFGSGDWFRSRVYKPVSVLRTEAETPPQGFIGTGEAKRPRSPVFARSSREDGGDILITWSRRTRLSTPGLGYGEAPLGEEAELYEVDVLIDGNAVRTIAASTPAATYTAAQQTADGLALAGYVDVRIYQLSAARGRGWPCAARVGG